MTNFRFLFERGIRIIESRQRNVSRVISSNSRGLSYGGVCQEKGVVCVQLHII